MTAKRELDEAVDEEIGKRGAAEILRRERGINRKLQRRTEELESLLQAYETLAKSKPVKIPRRPSKGKAKKTHTMVGLISDTHTFELVDADRINGRNKHNPEIGKARLEKLFADTANQWKKHSKWADIPDICVCLMGDYLVNNLMHPPDSNESVGVSPLREAYEIGAILKGGIEYLLKNTTARIHVPCVAGNHGRMTRETRITNPADYSLEHFMHVDIADHFLRHPRVTVDAGVNRYKLVPVGGLNLLVMHGDPVLKGGKTLPSKVPAAYEELKRLFPEMDLMCAGHVHQAHYSASCGFINGSLVGYNDYSNHFAMRPERPSQWGFLVDHDDSEVGTVWRYWAD